MEVAELGATPIEEGNPTGSDVRYEPEFEELQSEIDKLTSPTATGGVDWKKVVNIASEILEKKSKDLLVASYLAVGLLHMKQMEGLAVGLKVFADLLENFWDNLFPPKKRLRGRLAAVEWWTERTELGLEKLGNQPISPETYEQMMSSIQRIEACLNQYFDEPPSVAAIARHLESLQPKEEPKPEEPSESGPAEPQAKEARQQPAPAQAAPSPTPPAPEDIGTPEDAKKLMGFALQKLRQAISFLWETSPTTPGPYRWRRAIVWWQIEALPPSTDGKTKIPPPPAQIKNILLKLREELNWEGLLKACEARASEFVFWFDLHFWSAEAMNYLGETYEKAREALCAETAYFLHRVPGIDELAFSDGTPFASDETKKWLKEIAMGKGVAMADALESSLKQPETDADNLMAEEIKKAQTLAKRKKIVDAVRLLQDHMQESITAKDRLLWRLALCQVLMTGKKAFLAVPHLEQILEDIENYKLEQWDPELALKGLKIAFIGFDSQSDEELKSKAKEMLNRIAKINPAEALRFKK